MDLASSTYLYQETMSTLISYTHEDFFISKSDYFLPKNRADQLWWGPCCTCQTTYGMVSMRGKVAAKINKGETTNEELAY